MKVLVTGGTGFIGSAVCTRLAEEGHTPVVFDRHIAGGQAFEWIIGDVRDATAVTEAVAHVDGVIHLAGVLGTQETIQNPRPAAETNVLGSLNVFEAMAQYDLPGLYIAVGNHWMENTYSISKTCAERFARMFNQERGTRIAIMRALNAYGPGQSVAAPFGPSKVRKVMPAFICRALSGQPIEVYGDGQQIMDMIHVRDLARLLVRGLVVGPHPDGLVYEAGSGAETSVLEIAELVNRLACGVGVAFTEMRPGEPDGARVVADVSTLHPLHHTRPLIPLDEGVAETIGWFRARRGTAWC